MDPKRDAWGETWGGSQKKSSWELLRHPSKLVWWLGPGVHYGAFTFPFGQTVTGTRWYKYLHVNIEFSPPFKGTSGVSETEVPCSWRTDNKLEYPRLNPEKKLVTGIPLGICASHIEFTWLFLHPIMICMSFVQLVLWSFVLLGSNEDLQRLNAVATVAEFPFHGCQMLPVIFAATRCTEHSIRPRRTNMEPSGTPEKDSSSVRLEQFHSHGKICVYKM